MFTSLSSCGGSKAASTGPTAVAPITHQLKLEIAVGDGAAYQDLLAELAAGDCAAAAGTVQNKGCAPIRLEISYLNDPNLCDADGDGCSDAALLPIEIVVQTFDVPANTSVDLQGLVAGIKVATLDEFGGALTANTAVQNVLWSSSYQPSGCGCVLVP